MDELVYKAKLAEQGERYEDMVKIMKEVANNAKELTLDQRNLLSVGYKNVVGVKRTAWRTISALESKEESRKNLKRAELARSFRIKIEISMSNAN